jgi:hypothetical protein
VSDQPNLATTLAADVANLIELNRSAWHGAIRRGVHLARRPGTRSLFVSGGTICTFEDLPNGAIRASNRTFTRSASKPVPFMVVAGPQAVVHEDGTPMVVREVPDAMAAVGGVPGTDALVTPARGTYRVDLLALAVDAEGVVEWFLILGAPSDARTLAASCDLETPAIPAGFEGDVWPIARVTTRNGSPGIAAAEVVAPRIS